MISFTFGGAKGMDGGIKRINAIRTVTKPSRKNSTRVTLPRRSRVYGCPFQIPVVFLRAFIGEVFISGVEGTSGPFRSLSYFREFICSLCESFGRRSTFISYLNLFTPTCYDLRVYRRDHLGSSCFLCRRAVRIWRALTTTISVEPAKLLRSSL